MDRGAWWATVHRAPKSQIWLSMHRNDNTDEKVCGRCSWVSDCWEQRQNDEGNWPVLRALGSSTPEATAFTGTLTPSLPWATSSGSLCSDPRGNIVKDCGCTNPSIFSSVQSLTRVRLFAIP